MEILFPNFTRYIPPSFELSLRKAKNVVPTTNTSNHVRKIRALLDEIICATCTATESLGNFNLFLFHNLITHFYEKDSDLIHNNSTSI